MNIYILIYYYNKININLLIIYVDNLKKYKLLLLRDVNFQEVKNILDLEYLLIVNRISLKEVKI